MEQKQSTLWAASQQATVKILVMSEREVFQYLYEVAKSDCISIYTRLASNLKQLKLFYNSSAPDQLLTQQKRWEIVSCISLTPEIELVIQYQTIVYFIKYVAAGQFVRVEIATVS